MNSCGCDSCNLLFSAKMFIFHSRRVLSCQTAQCTDFIRTAPKDAKSGDELFPFFLPGGNSLVTKQVKWTTKKKDDLKYESCCLPYIMCPGWGLGKRGKEVKEGREVPLSHYKSSLLSSQWQRWARRTVSFLYSSLIHLFFFLLLSSVR